MPRVRLPRLRAAWLGLVYAGLLLASTPGCSGIRVDRSRSVDPFPGWHFTSLRAGGDLSPRTRQTLRQWDLEQVYAERPTDAAARLHQLVCQDPQPDLVFALAEIHFSLGRAAERHDPSVAAAGYYLCAGYAYHYLFDPRTGLAAAADGDPAAVFDPRFRLACDLYNAGLARCIATAQRAGHLDPRRELHIPTGDGRHVVLSVSHAGFAWKDEEFGPLLFCDDYEVQGLANHYRTYGLGVPLIATRSPAAPPSRYFPPTASFAVTAFFRFDGGLADLGSQRCGRLELYNPLVAQSVAVAGRQVPLETDLTTPLAYFLAQSNLDEIGLKGFVYADRIRGRTGVHMLAPYQPGKVPVVLVHGLLSSPLTWAPVFNDLQADPVLRERCQFWYYFYPTGEPYLVAAANLRAELERMRHDLDPDGKDPALGRMVFVGHSMGGLVSKLLTVDGGDDFWRLVSSEPLDRLKLKDQSRQELRDTFYFQRESCVKRVVFLGTPHHGSRLSPTSLGRLADRLVHLPQDLMDAAQDAAAENPDLAKVLQQRPLPTSVDLLAPGAPALEVLAARPRPPDVHYHSIIGKLPPKDTPIETWLSGDKEPGDGVVPYTSAHLTGTDSELVVPADHFHVHHHPRAVQEVRRILLEHTEDAVRAGLVLPAGHTSAATSPR
jgi:pimeloyl-ACP methyl ester carboxylesterase